MTETYCRLKNKCFYDNPGNNGGLMIKQQFNSKAAIPLGLAHTPLNFMIVLFDPAV